MAKKTKTKTTAETEHGSSDALNYKKVPALAAYVDRIGAEQLNFRRFIVKEHRDKYYIERSIIRIRADGTIYATKKEHAPTDEEAAAIKEAVLREKWPTAIGATESATNDLLKKLSGPAHVFWHRDRKHVVMVQERVEIDGRKAYLPWSFFSDGKWRRLEPEGLLPFWKPKQPSDRKRAIRIMIHEGAKAASAADAIVRDKTPHPWLEELSEWSHWGMIGGALAPQRTDYDELRAEKPAEVAYFCDNDWEGQSALQDVSRLWGGQLIGVRLDGRWPPSWDIADDVPKEMMRGTRWVGPRLSDMMKSATRATEVVPPRGGKGKGAVTLLRPFREEWHHCVTPEVFVNRRWPDRILTLQEFNNQVRPFSDVPDTAHLVHADDAAKTAVLKYDPDKKSGVYGSADAGRFINTYREPTIRAERGSQKPFTDFMEHLVEVPEDRHELMKWCATLVAVPGVKMKYGVLMISEVQGVGKGTLGEKILAPLLGDWNVSFPSEDDICDSSFNYWLAHRRLAVIHEIYAGHSAKAYNKLKSIVTDRSISVKKKYMADYVIQNWLHIFACSNSMRAIQLSADDRRWLVPKVTEEKKSPEYWTRLNTWLTDEGGLGIVRQWATDFVKKHGAVTDSADAPWTSQKKEVVEEGYSPGQVVVSNFLRRVEEEAKDPAWVEAHCRAPWATSYEASGVLVLDRDLVSLIRSAIHEGRHSDRLEKPLTVRKIAKSRGWSVVEGRAAIERWGTMGTATRLLVTEKTLSGASPAVLADSLRPIEVLRLASEWKVF